MAKQDFLIIGVGRFGSALAGTLYQQGHEVVAVDRDEARIERLIHDVSHALIADGTDEEFLKGLGVANFDVVVIAIGHDFEANVLATVTVKKLGAKRVISKAASNTAAEVLRRVGADQVIRPEHDMGVRLAKQLTTPHLIDAIDLGEDHSVIEVEATDELTGTLAKLRLPNRFHVQVIAVNRGWELYVSPRADFEVQRGDKVVLIGSNQAIAAFRAHLAT